MSASTIVTRRNVPLIASVAILLEAGEAIGLILLRERFDEIVDVAVHAPIQVREVVPEAPVSETILWEVVRPHLLRALAAPDLGVARGRLACRALLRGARCTPDSNLSFEYAPLPDTLKMISLKPPFSDWLCERISVFQRWRSAYRAYMR